MDELRFQVESEDETASAARLLAEILVGKQISIGLVGPLGAGKTAFTRFFLRSLSPGLQVVSPSYVLEQRYEIPISGASDPVFRVSHWDLYRLAVGEFPEDLRECFNESALLVIEWPERSEEVVKMLDIRVVLDFVEFAPDRTRSFLISAQSSLGIGALSQFAQRLERQSLRGGTAV